MSESLKKRLEYLGIADMDYLSARILLINGITHTGLSKAAEAFEKIFKLFLLLEDKISKSDKLTQKQLKEYKHKLVKLFEIVAAKLPIKYDQAIKDYFQQLENAYEIRYPESWKEAKLINNIDDLDEMYCHFRNNVTSNFPLEEQEKVKYFGTFLLKAYKREIVDIIVKQGGMSPKESFSKNNNRIKDFNINYSDIPN